MTGTAEHVPEHVLLVVIDLAGGGTQRVVAGLARALRDAGTRVTIVTNRTSDGRWGDLRTTADFCEIPGELRVHGGSGSPAVIRNVRWLLTGACSIRRALRSVAPGTPALSFLPGTNVLTSLARLGVDVPLVLSERNDVARQPMSPILRAARRLLYRTATVVTTNRPDDVETLQALAGRVPVHLVNNPPPSFAGRASPSASRRIISAGRLAAHKRHRDILLAFSALAEDFPDWTLRVLGDGPEQPRLETLVSELGLNGRVELPGWSSDVVEELARSAVFVHASEYEGTSNAVLEAMGSGLPVVASGPSDPTQAGAEVGPASSGIRVFAAGDVPVLTSHLRDLLSDSGLRDELGSRAARAVARMTGDPVSTWSPVIRTARQRLSALT